MQIFATAFAILLLLYNTLKAPIKYFIICSAFRRSTGIMLDLVGFFRLFVCFLLLCSAPYLDLGWPMQYLNDSFLRFCPPPPFSLKFDISCQWKLKQHKEDQHSVTPPPQKKKDSDNDFQLFYSEKKVNL